MSKFVYGEMTWPEIREVAAQDRVAVLPVATIEDHGHHLPVNTDVLLCTEICHRACERTPDDVVLVPPVIHGYSPHHMDFPGPLTVRAEVFTSYVSDLTISLVRHGFRRILVVNGHGSNGPLVDMAARRTVVETDAMCAALSYWSLPSVKRAVAELRESEVGGISHACEFETSLYLALRRELVQTDKIVRDMNYPPSKYFKTDMFGAPEAISPGMMLWWSMQSATGVRGDPTKASKEKGEAFLEAAVSGLADLIKEFRTLPGLERIDHH